MKYAIGNKSILGGSGVGFLFIVAPASHCDRTGIAKIKSPFRGVHIGAGTVKLVAKNKIGESVNGGSPTTK